MNNIDTPSNEAMMRSASNPFIGGIGTETPTSGLDSSGLKRLLSSIPGLSDILSSIFGGGDIQRGLSQEQGDIRQGIGTQQQMLGQSLASLAPFLGIGQAAGASELGMLRGGQNPAQLISGIASQFQQSPAQKAAIAAGSSALQNQLQSQGINLSGAADEALQNFGQQQTAGQMGQFINQALSGREQTLGGLQGLSGQGLQAAGMGTQARQSAGDNIASLLGSLGQSQIGQGATQAGQTAGAIGGFGSVIAKLLPYLATL